MTQLSTRQVRLPSRQLAVHISWCTLMWTLGCLDTADPSAIERATADAGKPLPDGLDEEFEWRLPDWFPEPTVPDDNPMSVAKVELGRHLFYDTRLSENGTQSCGSCHQQALAFTDGRVVAQGSTGELHTRNTMSLVNLVYTATFTWADPYLRRLEDQVPIPLFGDDPVELGMAGREAELLARLDADAWYRRMFRHAFPERAEPISVTTLSQALAAFMRSILSGDAPYDRHLQGDTTALSPAAERGLRLFFSQRTQCFRCHGGIILSDSVARPDIPEGEGIFHNTGLYDIDGRGGYPATDTGLHRITRRPTDMGRFRTPTLRNIALTAPYMHDGSIATLEEVIDHYAAGGRALVDGPHAGIGSDNPYKSVLVSGFVITADEKQDLLEFLHSLTDHALLTDPRYADPW